MVTMQPGNHGDVMYYRKKKSFFGFGFSKTEIIHSLSCGVFFWLKSLNGLIDWIFDRSKYKSCFVLTSFTRTRLTTVHHSIKTRTESPSLPVAQWPTASSTVNSEHIIFINIFVFSWTVNSSSPQTPSPWTMTLPALPFPSLCCGKASRGTRTKTSNTATQRRLTTWLWNRSLKVKKQAFFSFHLFADAPCWFERVSAGTAPPPFWQKPVYNLDPLDTANNGFINDDLIVWMREAAFPNFKKLYGILHRANQPFTKGLPVGTYSLDISYSILLSNPLQRLMNVNVFVLFWPLTSCSSRLSCSVLPGQKGSGADHADLVRRSEPLPAHRLPGDQRPDPADSRRPHRGLVEVREGREEHGGVKLTWLLARRQILKNEDFSVRKKIK